MYNKGKEIDETILDYIKSHFSYNPINGVITRDDRANSSGSLDKDGYLIIKIKTQQFKAHRIAWFLYYGKFPIMEIDHINRNRLDNRIKNLREVDRDGNNKNSTHKKNPETGIIGVYIDKCTEGLKKKYTTRFDGKTYRFYHLNEAIEFRKKHNLEI
jgi:hypothetical protein